MVDTITYHDMEQFLTDELHFQAYNIEGSHTTFKRVGTDAEKDVGEGTVIVLNPWYKILPKRQLAYVRQMLVQKDIVSAHKFDEWLHYFQQSNGQMPSLTQ